MKHLDRKKVLLILALVLVATIAFLDLLIRVYLRRDGLCVLNWGFAFGWGEISSILVILLKIVFLMGIGYLFLTELKDCVIQKKLLIISLFTILVGGFTTLIEKIVYGTICDYIPFFLIDRLYVNLVDVMIVLAVFILLVKYLQQIFSKKK